MKLRLLLAALTLLTAGESLQAVSQSHHAAPGFTESEIKAAFIVNLFSFIEWPANSKPALLCVTQNNATAAAVRALLEARAGLNIRVQLYEETAEGFSGCDAVFIPRGSLVAPFAPRADQPVLTVSDMEGFAEQGGMIEFERRPSRVGLVINNDELEASGFTVSSRLLSLARVVSTGARDEP